MVIEIVFSVGDVVVVNAFYDGAIAEILIDIEIVLPPLGGRCAIPIGTDEAGDIGAVVDLGGALIV